MSKIENPLLNGSKDNVVKCILLPNHNSSNELCYIAIINTQMTLNKNRIFEVYNNLDANIKGVKCAHINIF